ncbi:MAG TPA: isochorismatase family protein [Nitrolancea sp.]|nr:isochorismatase family protein [Nitrolancea sp.]
MLLIDAQPAFWHGMAGASEPVMARLEQLLLLAGSLQRPLIATFEHPVETKGWLPERLEHVFPEHGQRLIKHTFNCCAEATIRTALTALDVRQIVVAGSETDVCVLQSVLGLIELGYQVFLMEDGLFTSEPHPGPALQRMYGAGAIPITYKTLYYELKKTVDTESFHRTWNARFAEGQPRYVGPETLPDWEPAH